MSPRILVVDDEREILGLVSACLEESSYEVLVAHDGETALRVLRHERPDLMLLALPPPEPDGWPVAGAARSDAALAAMPLILLTADVGDDTSAQLQGADDPAAEPFNSGEVVARVRALLRRMPGETVPPKMIQAQALRIDLDARRVEVGGQLVHLTPTEFGLLRALAEQQGRVLTRQEMIEKGLGYSYEGVERTVDSHVKNLRHKLDEAGEAAHLVQTVFGVGYRLAPGGVT
jgi:two-component system alkaline phosphatase synthesis response regulator PhoP